MGLEGLLALAYFDPSLFPSLFKVVKGVWGYSSVVVCKVVCKALDLIPSIKLMDE